MYYPQRINVDRELSLYGRQHLSSQMSQPVWETACRPHHDADRDCIEQVACKMYNKTMILWRVKTVRCRRLERSELGRSRSTYSNLLKGKRLRARPRQANMKTYKVITPFINISLLLQRVQWINIFRGAYMHSKITCAGHRCGCHVEIQEDSGSDCQ